MKHFLTNGFVAVLAGVLMSVFGEFLDVRVVHGLAFYWVAVVQVIVFYELDRP